MKHLYEYKDHIPGGKGDRLSPADVDQTELLVGIEVEREHAGDDTDLATEISLDHLKEDPKYYSKLVSSGIVDEPAALDLARSAGWLNENFKLVDLGNHRWFGNKQDDSEYTERVSDHCKYIMQTELAVSEKWFEGMDRVFDQFNKTIKERSQEYEAILHNCRTRNMRAEYCAETVYHALLQGRVDQLRTREWVNGGFSR